MDDPRPKPAWCTGVGHGGSRESTFFGVPPILFIVLWRSFLVRRCHPLLRSGCVGIALCPVVFPLRHPGVSWASFRRPVPLPFHTRGVVCGRPSLVPPRVRCVSCVHRVCTFSDRHQDVLFDDASGGWVMLHAAGDKAVWSFVDDPV